MMSTRKEGIKNLPMVIWLVSLSLLVLAAGPAWALSQYTDLTCASCHGMPPIDSSTRDWKTGAFQGNHQTHLPAGATAAACTECHNNAAYTLEHSDNVIQMNARINNYSTVGSAARYNKPVFFNQTTKPVLMTCSNVNCHFEATTGNWGATALVAPAGCAYCHGASPATGSHPAATSASGQKHASYYGTDTASCVKCHPNHTTFAHATSAGKRGLLIQFTAAPNTGGTYSGNVAYPNYLPSKNPARNGTCSAVYCHSNGAGGAAAVTPVWGGAVTANCSGCHAGKPVTNAHGAHVNKAAIGCEVCHAAVATNGTTILSQSLHVNGAKNVDFAGAAAGTLWAAPTCTGYCHSNGKGTTQAVSWTSGVTMTCASCHPTLSGAHTAHIGTLLSSATFYSYTATKSSGSELTTGSYMFGCANCHPTDMTKHLNGTIEVTMAPVVGNGALRAKNSASAAATVITAGSNLTCSGIYCHSNGQATPTFATAPNWYGGALTGDKCAACHGNSPTTGAHVAHAVGIHYDDIFNGVNGKLASAAAVGTSAGHGDPNQSTTLSCNICHNTTINVAYNDKNATCSTAACHDVAPRLKGNAAITNRSLHVNGTVELAFAGVAIKSKAQLRPDTFSDYTAAGGYWTRNSYKAGAASTDTAKLTLTNTMYNSGTCSNIACHMGKAVNWTSDVGKAKDCTLCHSKL